MALSLQTTLQAATDDDILVNLDTTSVFTVAWFPINSICKMKPTFVCFQMYYQKSIKDSAKNNRKMA